MTAGLHCWMCNACQPVVTPTTTISRSSRRTLMRCKEYAARRDIYGADAVAWTALKAGKVAEAEAAVRDAFRLGTEDARIFYHAGMIALAAGDDATSRTYLQRALSLNPQFDPLQRAIARLALAGEHV